MGHVQNTDKLWQGSAVILMDLDCFFASVEMLDHPEWRGKPVIVGGDAKRRGVVSTASYEARAFGVHSAMPAVTAKRLCPQAIWTHGHFERYIEVSKQVMAILANHSPTIQQCSIDEAFLDVTPGPHLGGDPISCARQIQAEVAALGVTCSVGLSANKTVSKIASEVDKPRGLTIVYPGQEAAFLAPLPLRRMSGLGAKSVAKLRRLGLSTLGDLADCDLTLLKPIFGKNAAEMRERAAGRDRSAVEATDKVKSVSNEVTFSSDLIEPTELRQAIYMVAQKTGLRLRNKSLKGRTVALKLRYADLSSRSARRTLPAPVDNERDFIDVLYQLLPELWQPGDHIRLIGVAVSGFDRADAGQTSLFDSPAQELNQDLVAATDKVKNRFGDDALRLGRDLRFADRSTLTPARPSRV
ncbi:MAG: DNA polymerase IV [Coriobacteriales bacterium]|jgi:DNA polymerase-4|nr:DNA polymerase IV [Coriobacteriales bacterium]